MMCPPTATQSSVSCTHAAALPGRCWLETAVVLSAVLQREVRGSMGETRSVCGRTPVAGHAPLLKDSAGPRNSTEVDHMRSLTAADNRSYWWRRLCDAISLPLSTSQSKVRHQMCVLTVQLGFWLGEASLDIQIPSEPSL
ncbi:hypothetical protein PAMP_011831 [Pampus punctatissimus]